MDPIDLRTTGEVGNGAGELENAGVAAGRESELVRDLFQQGITLSIKLAKAADVASLHLTVGMQAEGGQALALKITGVVDPRTNGAGRFPDGDIG